MDIKRRGKMRVLRWAQQQRLRFISKRLETPGFVNRRDLMDFFGVSMPTASLDLQSFLKAHPDAMRYNPNSKRYERVAPSTSHE